MSIAATDWVAHHAYFKGDHKAMVDLASDRHFTYSDMHERVGRVAAMLEAKGVGPGDRVAFLMFNSTDLMEVLYGCWRIGAVCLALNFRLTVPELKFILNDAETSALVYDHAFQPQIDGLQGETTISHFIGTDCMGGASDYENGLAAVTPRYDFHPQTLEDQCMLMYSSGTTGLPKGVIITHGMMDAAPTAAVRVGGVYPDNVSLSNMPLFHIGALNVTGCPAIWVGGTAVIQRIFDVEATLDAINDPDLGITSLFLVPAALNALRMHPKAETTDFSRIRSALSGGAPVPTEIMVWWEKKGLIVQQGYGMTETAAAGTAVTKEEAMTRIGSTGRHLMHSKIRIVDDNGQDCAPNVPGEIWFKGAAITPGYWRRPDANAESFVDGWFRSGDIGRMDAEGYVYIEDRMKDMYISGGENVYPAEIENILYKMPQIAEAAIIGVKDPRWGETGCVIAALKPDCELDLPGVLDHLSGQVAKFKLPQHLHIVDALPRNATGKVLKFQLRETIPPILGIE